ncbi:hypothetical protein Val02_63090 [Virgisporangium aliadipatigenens]|uniref:Type I-U CRISPR-associated protein Cas7 n=1 Tax=Virgisporangium aliadipatigenens TaxID=741659 RepID=A0A8J4DTV6_9ACTN|nr:type I-U CRISPR-associated RAMP protein Csb1/Cas7u [Virgisporangium aliadipatigenens]GIJ49423.1 hypothetical protein Val02_63090 [Virgisporangium aliadipatigenens]
MGVSKFVDQLAEAVALSGNRAVVRVSAVYEPAGGSGAKVFPPTYPSRDGAPYVRESRLIDGKPREDVVLDSVASQANRAEEALLRARRSGLIEIPLMELRHSGEIGVVLTSLEWPHRYADAYLRDSLLGGARFDRTDLGRSLQAASAADASSLYRHDPGSLVFGAWNSHRKGRQQKFPRVYSSEVVGWDPVVGARNAGRLDPLNLVGAARRNGDDWEFLPVGEKIKGEKFSEIGHGNVAPNPQHGGVTISSASRSATLSMAGLDRIGFGDVSVEAAVAARTVLAAYALVADRLAFGGASMWLRSGCELVLTDERLEWVGRGGTVERFELATDHAIEVLQVAVDRANKAGMAWSTETVELTPTPSLAKAIEFSLTRVTTVED